MAPAAEVPPEPAAEPAAVETAAANDSGAPPAHSADGPTRPPRRRRRRRRPRLPAAPGAAAANDSAEPAGGETGTPSGEAAPDVAAVDAAAAPAADASGRPILRLRSRRRRRRRPAAPGLLPGPAEGAAGAAPVADNAEAAAASSPVAPRQRAFSVPRRRRRQAPLSAATEAGDPAVGETAAGGEAVPRPRHRRRRRAAPGDAAAAENATAAPQARDPRPSRGRRDPHDGSTDQRNLRPRDGPPGRGRHDGRGGGRDRPRQVERQLYTVDAVVDRGFDDVEEEAGARRVHWTIVKRTTADQVSRKALSAVYVLQRDGADSEFPSLGAARNAVNKTIVHPEKLTRSKAEYAAEKAGKK